jgi:hypothetical protein
VSDFTQEQLDALDRIDELATQLAGPDGRRCPACGGTGEYTADGFAWWECLRCSGEGLIEN